MSLAKLRLIRLFWIFFEKFGLVFLSIISFFTFALFLTPSQLGVGILLLSAVELFSMFLIAVVDSSIIRLKTITKENDGTAFWLLLFASSVISTSLYYAYIWYFNEINIQLAALIAVLLLPLQAMSRIHVIHMRKRKAFKKLASRAIIGKLAGMAVGIYLAVCGFGELAIVTQSTVVAAVSTILLFGTERRKFPLVIDLKWAKNQILIGVPASYKVLNTNLYSKGAIFIIEGILGTQAVGYYNFANRLVELPRTAILTALMGYAHPVFCEKNNRGEKLEGFFLSCSKIGLIFIIPMFIGLSLIAAPLITLLFDDKWQPSVLVLIGISALTSFNLIFSFLPSILIAKGRTKLGLKGQIFSSIAALTLLYFLLEDFGLVSIIYALGLRLAILFPVNLYSLSKVTKGIIGEFLIICFKNYSACAAMVLTVSIYKMNSADLSPLIEIATTITIAVPTYAIIFLVFNKNIVNEIKQFINN